MIHPFTSRSITNHKRAFCAWLLVAFTLVAHVIYGANLESEFAAGNQAYEQGHFAEAAAHYENVITNGGGTATAWFNLGNARFKSNELGRAIAAWRRAERIDPRDSALRANLNFARRRANGGTDPNTSLLREATRYLTVNEWAALASVFWAAFFATLAWREIRRKAGRPAPSNSAVAILLTLSIVALVFARLSYADAQQRREGVILRNAVVRFGPLEDSRVAFQLPDGAEVEITDKSDGWLQLKDSTGRTGWAKREEILPISPSAQP